MSPQDSQTLHDFLAQLIQARGIQKDPEADALIQRAVEQQPDAAYLLVQRSLLMEQALNNAKGRIAALENQVRSIPQGQGGRQGDGQFPDPNSWGNSGGSRPAQGSVQQYQPGYPQGGQQPYPQGQQPYPPAYQPGYQPGGGMMGGGGMFGGMMGQGGGGFLRGGGGGLLSSIATTAAGVAAGSFLFHGLDNMFHHHDQGGSNHLLNGDQFGNDQSNNLFSDQSGSSLADQAGLGDVGQSFGSSQDGVFDSGSQDQGLLDSGSGDVASEGLFDSGLDSGGSLDSSGGFFDGDGSDEGLFS
jgi:hypothetical protein